MTGGFRRFTDKLRSSLTGSPRNATPQPEPVPVEVRSARQTFRGTTWDGRRLTVAVGAEGHEDLRVYFRDAGHDG